MLNYKQTLISIHTWIPIRLWDIHPQEFHEPILSLNRHRKKLTKCGAMPSNILSTLGWSLALVSCVSGVWIPKVVQKIKRGDILSRKPNTHINQSSNIDIDIIRGGVYADLNQSISIGPSSLVTLKPEELISTWPLVGPDVLILPMSFSHTKGMSFESLAKEKWVLTIYERVNERSLYYKNLWTYEA